MAAPPDRHPTDPTLQAYSLGQLDDILAEAVHKHLEGLPRLPRPGGGHVVG